MPIQSECHIFGIMLNAIAMDEGDIACFFFKDLGLALAPQMCPDKSQAYKKVNDSQYEKNVSFSFWTGRFQVLQGMLLPGFAQILKELTA